MAYEQGWFGLVALAGVLYALVGAWSRRAQRAAMLRVREMQHIERLAALERGLTPEDIFSHELEALEASAPVWDWAPRGRALAIILIAVGAAWVLAGRLSVPPQELHELWPIGIIPIGGGLGLLLASLLNRD